MKKYQKILKAVLLITVVSGTAFEVSASGGDAVPYEGEFAVDARRATLLRNPIKTRGSDHRHQVKSLELQEKIRSVERCAFGAEAQADTAAEYQGIFCELIYTKFKTVYDLKPERGGKPLNTTSSVFLEELDGKYEGFSAYEHGAIISPFKEMVELLHKMGIGEGFLCGLVTPDADELNPQFFLHRLMAALEVPDPSFIAEDLPLPYYTKVGNAGYARSATVPKKYLQAYVTMLDHLAYNFTKRLPVDVAMLRSMLKDGHTINEDGRLGLAEAPETMFLKPGCEVWVKKDALSLLDIWRPEVQYRETRKGQEGFARILQLYLPGFTLPDPLLDAAIPPNSLGMAYRLLQSAENDIHSWNHPFEVKGNAGIPEGLSPSTREFLSKVQDIVGRHYNLLVLQKMSDNVRALISTRLTAIAPLESPLDAKEREAAEREAQRLAVEELEAQRIAAEAEAQRIAAEELEAQRRATDPEALVEVEPGRFVKRKNILPDGGWRGGFNE